MRVLCVHPSRLMYSRIYLRLEPLGLELVAAAARNAGHSVQLIDLQSETEVDYFRLIERWRPHVVAFSGNYLANVPEIVDLAKATRKLLPETAVIVGGHSVSFTANEMLEHAEGAIDCVLRGEGEATFPQKIYDVGPSTWRKIYDAAAPAAFLPLERQTVDSVLADFNNDGRLDLFVLGGSQLRPSGVTQSSSTHFESQLAGGIKGFKFVTTGKVKFDIDWNKQSEVTGVDLKRIEYGANGIHPPGIPFTLDPANTNVRGMPPKPTTQAEIPVMQIGYDAVAKRWTLILWTQLTDTSQERTFSEAYLSIDSTASITGLAPTGMWTSDQPATPTLLMNYSGGFIDETAVANDVGGMDANAATNAGEEANLVANDLTTNDADTNLANGM